MVELGLPLLSGVLWSVAYIAIIRASSSDETFGVPLIACMLNLSWEALYFTGGVLRWSDYDLDTHVQTAVNGLWLCLDLIIFCQVIKYFPREFPKLARHRLLIPCALLVACILLQLAFVMPIDPQLAARLSAFTQNAVMSIGFVCLLYSRGTAGQRQFIAAAKLLGTLTATISAGIVGVIVPYVVLIGAVCLCFDLIYLAVLNSSSRRSRQLEAAAE